MKVPAPEQVKEKLLKRVYRLLYRPLVPLRFVRVRRLLRRVELISQLEK